MAEAQEEPADLTMSNGQKEPVLLGKNKALEDPAISAPDAQPAESTMVATPDEEIDSRTLIAGRKRNLQEFSLTQELSGAHEVSDEERSRKRLKDHQQLPPTEEGLATNITSPLRVSSPDKVEVDLSHQSPPAGEPSVYQLLREETAQSQAPGASSQSLFDLVGQGLTPSPTKADATQPATTQPKLAPQTWNAGVQSGLRISFGSRASLVSKSTIADALEGNTTPEAAHTGSLARALGGSSYPSLVVPFKPLTREEEANLTGDEKGRYLKAIFNHLRDPPPINSAVPKNMLNQDSNISGGEDNRNMDYAENSSTNANFPGNGQLLPWQSSSGSFRKLKARNMELLTPEQRVQYTRAHYDHLAQNRDKREAKKKKRLAARAAESKVEPPTFHQGASLLTIKAEPSVISQNDDHVLSNGDENDGEASDDEEAEDDENETSNDDPAIATNPPEQNSGSLIPFKKLKRKHVEKLSDRDRAEYLKALAAFKKENTSPKDTETQQSNPKKGAKAARRQIQARTTLAELAIVRTGPLSNQDQESIHEVDSGLTYYARRPKNQNLKYTNSHGEWSIDEVFDAQGRPYKLDDFNFNIFAPAFLFHNSGNLENITKKMLVAAFGLYVAKFYSHFQVSETKTLRSSASGEHALSLGAATELSVNPPNQPAPALEHRLRASAAAHKPSGNSMTVHSATADFPAAAEPQHDAENAISTEDVPMGDVDSAVAPVDTFDVDSGQVEPDDEASMDVDPVNIELQQAELFLQQRYFPSTDLTVQRCLACSKAGHNNSNCPYMTCTHCGTSGVHSNVTCPKQRRCQKCRERGHQSTECPEKLSLPRSEMACDLCGSPEHLENGCHCVWRSFDPNPEEIFTVRDIPVNCYTCGSGDHFGPECGLHRTLLLTGGFTWSKDNLLKYVDHSSQNRALSAGVDYSIPKRASKTGNANDPITIDDESDSEEEAFLRPKVARPVNANNGKIQVKTQQAQQSHEFNQPLPQRGRKPNPKNQPKKQQNQQTAQSGLSNLPKKPKQKGMQNQKPHVQKQPDPNYTRNPNPPRESRPTAFHRNPEKWHPTPGTAPPTGPSNRGSQNNQNNVGTGNAGVKKPKKTRQQRQRGKATAVAGNVSSGAGARGQ